MKKRLLVLVGLASGLAVPAFAQQKDSVDPQIIERLDARSKKYDEAFNNRNAAAVAALFTADAVLVTNKGPIYGREAIKKYHADLFQQVYFSNHRSTMDQDFPHT